MRKSADTYRRPVTVTLPSTLVTAFDSTLRRGQSRSAVVEELIRQELIRQDIDPDAQKSSSETS